MSNLNFHELRTYVIERVKDISLVKKTLSIALGVSLSRSIELPSSEVDYAEGHYNDQIIQQVTQLAAQFNEEVVIDFDLAVQTARAFWLIRYYHAHPPKTVPIPNDNEGHFMSTIVGVGHLVNPDTFEFCQKNSRSLAAIINRIREVTDTLAGKA